VSEGRTPMPSFSKGFSEDERWSVVNYIRTLSKREPDQGAPTKAPPQPSPEPAKKADSPTPQRGERGRLVSRQDFQKLKTDQEELKRDVEALKAQIEGAAKKEPFDYFHVLINPLPIYGLATAVLALTASLILRNRPAQLVALGLVVLTA